MHIFLSPHPDDAPLSCGGLIHQLTAGGQPVLILTTMGGDPPIIVPDTPLVRELHARWGIGSRPSQVRRDEDAAAAAFLGADIQFLDLPDCIYRRGADGQALYPDGEALFSTYQAGTDSAQDSRLIEVALGDRLYKATHLYFPLAVGHHVDHQIARAWADSLKLVVNEAEIWFYEDYPYSQTPGARAQVLASLPPESITRHDIVLSPSDVHAKIESIRCYGSQLSTFWPDWDTMAAQVTAFLTAGGTRSPMETYWIGER